MNICDYDIAEVLYITFVNNADTKEESKMAKAWEKAFIKFVSSYNGTYIKVHYSAEVSKAHLDVRIVRMCTYMYIPTYSVM